MKSIMTVILFLSIASNVLLMGDSVEGYYKSINTQQQVTTSIIAVYKYNQKMYGRIIVAFNEDTGEFIESYLSPRSRIQVHNSKPFLLEVDLFYDLEQDGDRYIKGKVLDVKTSEIFNAHIWKDKNDLILKGLFGPLGMKYRFYEATYEDFPSHVPVPPLDSFTPYSFN